MVKRFIHNLLVWFLISSATVAVLLGVGSCAPRNYFLVNSDLQMRYNQATGEWSLVWKSAAKHLKSDPDSIPVEPVKVDGRISFGLSPDSVRVSE